MTKPVLGPAREELQNDLAARYRAGATIQQLADATGRSYSGVHKLLDQAGVEFRAASKVAGQPRRQLVNDVVRRYDAGDSIRAIGVATGYSYTAVRNILVAEHVMLRRRGTARGSW